MRALAFNGAEVVYRPSEAVPMTQLGGEPGGTWLLQNRAHAHFNSLYVRRAERGAGLRAPADGAPVRHRRGGSGHIVDYQGQVLGLARSGANTFCAGIVDIEALRQFRDMNLNSNWMKDLRTEVFRRMYEQPIHPANLWLEDEPKQHAEVDEVYRANIERLVERGAWTRPAVTYDGCRFLPPSRDPADAELGERPRAVGGGD